MPTDPTTQLFINAATAIAVILGTLATQWLTARFSNEASKTSLKLTITELEKQIANLEANHKKREADSEAKNSELQTYIDKHLTKRAILAAFTVEPSNGDLLRDGFHFCLKCFHDGSDPPKEIQKSFSHGKYWCPICGKPPASRSFVGKDT